MCIDRGADGAEFSTVLRADTSAPSGDS